MAARAAAKKKPVRMRAYHAHGCTQCGRRYSDTCKDTGVNARCQTCRTGGKHDRPIWDRDMDPRHCCRTDSRRVEDSAEIERYALAGPDPWWRCRSCSRTSPYDPGTIKK